MNQTLGTDVCISEAIEKYSNMIRRICFLNLKNMADIEDIFQEVFLKYLLNYDSFQNEQHEKAWLCRVTFNQCKDFHKNFWHSRVSSIENLEIPYESQEQSQLIDSVLALPPNLKQVIYLHFYEGMNIPEIAALMNKNINTVYTNLRRAKARLKSELKEDYFNGML